MGRYRGCALVGRLVSAGIGCSGGLPRSETRLNVPGASRVVLLCAYAQGFLTAGLTLWAQSPAPERTRREDSSPTNSERTSCCFATRIAELSGPPKLFPNFVIPSLSRDLAFIGFSCSGGLPRSETRLNVPGASRVVLLCAYAQGFLTAGLTLWAQSRACGSVPPDQKKADGRPATKINRNNFTDIVTGFDP
jgi:hypothetical protein